MAQWTGRTFFELNTSRIARGVMTTSPDVRMHVTGGESVTAAPVVTDIQVEAICTTAELTALRDQLAYGDTGALNLETEDIEFCQLIEISQPVNIFDTDTWRCTLTFEVVGEVINPVIRFHVGNQLLGDVTSASVSVGRLSKYARATINCATEHGTRGAAVVIDGNVNFGVDVLFTGIVESISSDYFPGTWTLECVGRFKHLSRQWHDTEEYTGQTDGAMITNLVEKRGLPSHSIESSGWTLGTKADVILRPGDTFQQWIDELDEIAGYVTYERDDGVIYRRRHDPDYAASAATAVWQILEEGVNILSIRRSEDLDGIRNHIIVTGISHDAVEVTAEAIATNAELDALMPATAPNYNAVTINSPLIETTAHAQIIANRALSDRNRVWQSLEIAIPFMPGVLVDNTVEVIAPSLGIASALCQVWEVKHDFDGEGGTTIITTNTGTLGSL